jgi:hypothetical protein
MTKIQAVKVAALTTLVFLIGAVAGVQTDRAWHGDRKIEIEITPLPSRVAEPHDLKELGERLQPFLEAWLLLDANHRTKPDFATRLTGAIRGLTATYADRYTGYHPPTRGHPVLPSQTTGPASRPAPPAAPPVTTHSYFLRPGQHRVMYIKLDRFAHQSPAEFRELFKISREQRATGLILDLRHNPGGRIEACRRLASLWLGQQRLAWTYGRNQIQGELRAEPFDRRLTNAWAKLPTVVLVNHETASAAEMLAGALQDYGRAELVGSQTFGKGSIHVTHVLANNGQLQLTVEHFRTPKQRLVNGTGLRPDLYLPPGVAALVPPDQHLDLVVQSALARLTAGPRRR